MYSEYQIQVHSVFGDSDSVSGKPANLIYFIGTKVSSGDW